MTENRKEAVNEWNGYPNTHLPQSTYPLPTFIIWDRKYVKVLACLVSGMPHLIVLDNAR